MNAQLQDSVELVAPPAGVRLKLREIRLPVDKAQAAIGFVGPLVTEADSDALEACLVVDKRWMFGGDSVDDRDEPVRLRGLLGDPSLNPNGHKTPDAYIADARNTESNRKVAFHVWRRVRAIEAELERRAQTQAARQSQSRESSRVWLTQFLDLAPVVADQYQQRAAAVAAAEALVRPIADALALLMASYPKHSLPLAYADFSRAVADAASALGREAPECPALPAVPSHDDVKRMADELRGPADWPASTLPRDGRERVAFERLLKESRG